MEQMGGAAPGAQLRSRRIMTGPGIREIDQLIKYRGNGRGDGKKGLWDRWWHEGV
jgi:hypothetical protein